MGEAAKQHDDGEPQRHARRVNMEIEVGFHADSNFYVGFSENISEGGLFVATYDLKPVGTEIEIKLTLPDGSEVTTIGHVRWVRDTHNHDGEMPPGLGIQFRALTESQLCSIREFTRLQDPIFYPD